jgi:hypothetical protein
MSIEAKSAIKLIHWACTELEAISSEASNEIELGSFKAVPSGSTSPVS